MTVSPRGAQWQARAEAFFTRFASKFPSFWEIPHEFALPLLSHLSSTCSPPLAPTSTAKSSKTSVSNCTASGLSARSLPALARLLPRPPLPLAAALSRPFFRSQALLAPVFTLALDATGTWLRSAAYDPYADASLATVAGGSGGGGAGAGASAAAALGASPGHRTPLTATVTVNHNNGNDNSRSSRNLDRKDGSLRALERLYSHLSTTAHKANNGTAAAANTPLVRASALLRSALSSSFAETVANGGVLRAHLRRLRRGWGVGHGAVALEMCTVDPLVLMTADAGSTAAKSSRATDRASAVEGNESGSDDVAVALRHRAEHDGGVPPLFTLRCPQAATVTHRRVARTAWSWHVPASMPLSPNSNANKNSKSKSSNATTTHTALPVRSVTVSLGLPLPSFSLLPPDGRAITRTAPLDSPVTVAPAAAYAGAPGTLAIAGADAAEAAAVAVAAAVAFCRRHAAACHPAASSSVANDRGDETENRVGLLANTVQWPWLTVVAVRARHSLRTVTRLTFSEDLDELPEPPLTAHSRRRGAFAGVSPTDAAAQAAAAAVAAAAAAAGSSEHDHDHGGDGAALAAGVASLPFISEYAVALMSHGLFAQSARAWALLRARSSWPPQLAAAGLLGAMSELRLDSPPRALIDALLLAWDHNRGAVTVALALADAAALQGMWAAAFDWARTADDAARLPAPTQVAWTRTVTRYVNRKKQRGTATVSDTEKIVERVRGRTLTTSPAAPSPQPSLFASALGGGAHAGALSAGGAAAGSQPAATEADALWPLRLGDARARGYKAARLRGLAAARAGRWGACWDALERAAVGARWEMRNVHAATAMRVQKQSKNRNASNDVNGNYSAANDDYTEGEWMSFVVHAPTTLTVVPGMTDDILLPIWAANARSRVGDSNDDNERSDDGADTDLADDSTTANEEEQAVDGDSSSRAQLRRRQAATAAREQREQLQFARRLRQFQRQQQRQREAVLREGAPPQYLRSLLREYAAADAELDEASAKVLMHCRLLTVIGHNTRARRRNDGNADHSHPDKGDDSKSRNDDYATIAASLSNALSNMPAQTNIKASTTRAANTTSTQNDDLSADLLSSLAERYLHSRNTSLQGAGGYLASHGPVSFLQWAQQHPTADLAGSAAEGSVVLLTTVPVAVTVKTWSARCTATNAQYSDTLLRAGQASVLMQTPGRLCNENGNLPVMSLSRHVVTLPQWTILPLAAATVVAPAASAAAAAPAASAAWPAAAGAGAAAAAVTLWGEPGAALGAILSRYEETDI